jgi:16S rRNA (cytidine1402-2'-O)-methyltransferase
MGKMKTPQPTDCAAGSKPAPGLYLVATPIGNLGDISSRAESVLRAADLVACEDTRVTGKLLSLLGISAPLAAYHEHNADRAGPVLLERLRRREVVALVSDAGMPLVSDPGYRLVRGCIDEGLPVTVVPGPSAALTALALSGLPPDRFLFSGFLPAKTGARRKELESLKAVPATLIFFESPHRLVEALADMAAVLGPRPAAVARELTKLFEEVRRGPLDELAAHYAQAGGPKGEVVVVIGPPGEAPPPSDDDVDERLRRALAELSLRDAVDKVTAELSLPRRQVYTRAVALAKAEP